MRRAPVGDESHLVDDQINRVIAKVQTKVEHPFQAINRQFGHVKARYRGLAKN